jgi:hypothetical protein
MRNCITGFINLGYSTYASTADILVLEITVSLYASKYCTTRMCSVEELIYNVHNLFQFHISKYGSSEISKQ